MYFPVSLLFFFTAAPLESAPYCAISRAHSPAYVLFSYAGVPNMPFGVRAWRGWVDCQKVYPTEMLKELVRGESGEVPMRYAASRYMPMIFTPAPTEAYDGMMPGTVELP